MNDFDIKTVIVQTLNENSTHWALGSGTIGYFTYSEWCILITIAVTIITFIKNLIVDITKIRLMRKLVDNKKREGENEKGS